METIRNYLDNMFSGLERTAETERAKRELLNMMEDKYNQLIAEGRSENEAIGRVISEFGNLDELKQELGLSDADVIVNAKKRLDLKGSEEYLSASAKAANRIAVGVSICILSPVPLVTLVGAFSKNPESGSKLAVFIGLMLLFALVAVAVALFITTGIRLSKYDYLKNEEISLENGALAYVRDISDKFKQSYALLMTVGVVICVMSVVPLLGIAILLEDGKAVIIGVAILLILLNVY